MVRVLLIVAVVEAVLIAWLLSGREATSGPQGTAGASAAAGQCDGDQLEGNATAANQASGENPETGGTAGATDERRATDAGVASASSEGMEAPETPDSRTEETAIMHGKIGFTDGQEVTRWNEVWLFAEGKEAIPLRGRKDGTYAGAGLPPGHYEAHITSWATHGMSKAIELKPGGRVESDFEYRSFIPIPVKIVDAAGKSIFEVLRDGDRGAWKWIEHEFGVVATASHPKRGPPPSLENADDFGISRYAGQGKYSDSKTDDGRQGTLYLPRDEWPLHVSLLLRSEILVTKLLTARPDSISFTVDEEQFEKLLSGVTFTLSSDGDPSELKDGMLVLQRYFIDGLDRTAFERKGNRVTIRDQIPGRYALSVHFGKQLEDYHRYVDLPAGEILDLGNIHLRESTMDEFRILDAEGAPLPGASLTVTNLATAAAMQPLEFGRTTNAEGIAPFAYGPGRYFLTVGDPDGATYGFEIAAPISPGKPHDIRLPSAHPANFRLGPGLTGPLVMTVLAGEDRRVLRTSQTAPRILVLEFGAGSYTAVVTEGDGTVHRVPFEVGPDYVPTIVVEKGAN